VARTCAAGIGDARGDEEEDDEEDDRAEGGDAREGEHDAVPQVDVGLFEHAHIEHADDLAGDVLDRLIGGDVPVIHDEGPATQGTPGAGPRRGPLWTPGCRWPVSLGVRDVRRDAQVVLEYGDGPDLLALYFSP